MLADRVTLSLDAWQEQQLFLDVLGQAQQLLDQADPGSCDLPEPGQICVGFDLAQSNQFLEPDRQRAEAGNSRYVPGLDPGSDGLPASVDLLSPAAPRVK